jgi:transcriptional regulator with GAF, ATPase, and Fis domain
VLILGETGAGKGVLTRWIHANGPRAAEAFVDLNCASLPHELLESELFGHERGAFTGAVNAKLGLVELAHRGTLFLDEIGDLDLALQPKLLKALEEQTFRRVGAVKDRQVDLRLVAATHQDLASMVADNRFRRDLFFRISTLPLVVPPLRERRADIPLLARLLLARLSAEMGLGTIELAEDAEHALTEYAWPGNVRELRNVLERATLLSGKSRLQARDLHFDPLPMVVSASWTADVADIAAGDVTLEEAQRRHIVRVLEAVQGNVEAAAARLQVPRSTLYQRIKTLQITVPKGGIRR